MLSSSAQGAGGGDRDRAARASAGRPVGVPPWLGIQVRHLAALEAIADEGSFNKAAKRLGYTQSAISQQVAALEKIVGEQLVVRPERFKPVTPTPAGEIMLAQARGILARLRAAHGALQELREGAKGVVRVGIFHGVGSLVAGAIVQRFPLGDPGVQLRLVHAAADAELLAPLARGEIDLAFVTLPLEPGPLVGEELLSEEFQLVLSPDDELARKPKLALADLDGRRIVCLRRCRATTLALARLDAHGVRPDVVYRSDDVGTLAGLVRAGATAALLPALAVEEAGDLVSRPFDPPQLLRRIGLAWRREQPPGGTAAEFVATVREALVEQGRRARAS
jgi:DNA-binding transcriptional LysR family regulator